MGFESYGIDISIEAIKSAKENLKTKNLKAELKVNNCINLPFNDNFFDLVISHGVLDHITFEDVKKSINEIKRVTKSGGYIYLTLISNEDCDFDKGKLIGKNTFKIKDGYENGLIQHYFDKSEIKEFFDGLKVFDIEMYDVKFPSVFTADKAHLQTSTNMKKYFDLSKFPDLNLKYSRWYIAAENP